MFILLKGEWSKATLLIFLVMLIFVCKNLFANDSLSINSIENPILIENDIDNTRATIASVGMICGLYFANEQFKESWGESSGSFHLKNGDWDFDGLAQNDELSHFIASKLLVQFCGSIAEWVGFTSDNSLLIGDRRYARIYEKTGVVITRGTPNAQFLEDEMTIKARKRMLLLVKNGDKSGFRKVTDVTAALVLLAS
jgi:hypothetical protein